MLGNVQPTQYDLRFSLFGIPVRVHPLFWLMAAFVVWNAVEGRLDLVVIGMIVVFVSVLVHELGHAFVMRAYGWPPNILLYHFGGLAMSPMARSLSPLRSILLSLAGPFAGFLLYGIVWSFDFYLHQIQSPWLLQIRVFVAIYFLKWVNLYWGLLNLLPIYPLDGGQVSRSLFSMWRTSGVADSLKLSILTAAGIAGYFLYEGNYFMAILIGSLAASSYQQLQFYGNRRW